MHYNYVDFLNLSIKERAKLQELTLDCREINLLRDSNLRLLCSKIKDCSDLEKCTLIYNHVNEEFAFNDLKNKNILISNGNGCRYMEIGNYKYLASLNMVASIIIAICYIHYLSTVQLSLHSKYYIGYLNSVPFTQGLLVLLVGNFRELLCYHSANKCLDNIVQHRLKILSEAFTECSLKDNEPKIASYFDHGEGFISLHEEKYFLGIDVVQLLETIKDTIEEKIFIVEDTEILTAKPSTSILNNFNSISSVNSNNYHTVDTLIDKTEILNLNIPQLSPG